MSRQVNHDRDAGVFSSRITIATSAHTCLPHVISLEGCVHFDSMTSSQLRLILANKTVTAHKAQCTVLCAQLHGLVEVDRAQRSHPSSEQQCNI